MNENVNRSYFPGLRWYIPTTWADVKRRSGIRLTYCAIPYVVIAYGFGWLNNNRWLDSTMFWWCVVIVPVTGFLLDLWRVQHPKAANDNVPGS